MGGGGDGCGGEVELCVVGVAVEMEAMAAEDLTKGKDVEDKQERAKHRALGDTVGDRGCDGVAVVYGDELMSVREVGREPGEGCSSDTEGGFES